MTEINSTAIGTIVEEIAVNFLAQHQVKILHRNFYCRLGELDLVAQDRNDLVFVEVRYRKNSVYGSAADSIDWRKQQKILKTAEFFLQQRNCADLPCRFDVVAISNSIQAPQIEWIKDAFNA